MRGSFDLNNEHSFRHLMTAMGYRGYLPGDPYSYGLRYFSSIFSNTPANSILNGVGVEDYALGINEGTYEKFVLQAVNEVVLPGETKIEAGDNFLEAIEQNKDAIILRMNELLDAAREQAREQARINRDDGDAVEKPDGPDGPDGPEEEDEVAAFGGGKRRRRSKRRRRRPSTKKRVTRKSRRSKTRRSKTRRRSKRRSRRN